MTLAQSISDIHPGTHHTPLPRVSNAPFANSHSDGPSHVVPCYTDCDLRMQDGRSISVGDFVELQPAPGELLPTVAQLQELWSETPADGQPRMLARVCRFYRPQVPSLSASALYNPS